MRYLKVIDVNQSITFLEFIEKMFPERYDDIWLKFEQLIIHDLRTKLKARDIAFLSLKYSSRGIASIDFWKLMNQKFLEFQPFLQPLDFT